MWLWLALPAFTLAGTPRTGGADLRSIQQLQPRDHIEEMRTYNWRDIVRIFDFCSARLDKDLTLYDLHPTSLTLMGQWIKGWASDATFRRKFHIVNSHYMGMANCMIVITSSTLA